MTIAYGVEQRILSQIKYLCKAVLTPKHLHDLVLIKQLKTKALHPLLFSRRNTRNKCTATTIPLLSRNRMSIQFPKLLKYPAANKLGEVYFHHFLRACSDGSLNMHGYFNWHLQQ